MDLLEQYFNVYLASLIMWGFLMAFLYNLVKKSSKPNNDATIMWLSFIIFFSYLIADPLLNSSIGVEITSNFIGYLVWAFLDFITLAIILFFTSRKSIRSYPAKLYIVVGFSVNMLLFIAMYVDIALFAHYEPWWFWYFYSATVNVMDVMMIIALLCNKDFLGLVRGYNRLRGLLKPEASPKA
ncbi:hypothetical protein H5200_11460 [Pseudoalteromonas sp. SG43-7]|uniref:hypothetical protein n=1 Tax=Pseudoalteromonas sp. SG43-7 TaxID=2760966 RepID=UPI0016015C9D|nr:hypothetical protein [Pseudoalteromonas sp. SG43-7]MBB1422536.1 hypothetical protein [Pseudoalteromonas sp. SG43-7]